MSQESWGIKWPYPIRYGIENKVDVDILVIGGGAAGCFAAMSAARTGAKVAIAEKGSTISSGAGGAGIDHWGHAPDNPCSKIAPEELYRALLDTRGGYSNGITDYITCMTNYETLLELEKIGAKVRDTDDEFKGAEFRDEETKLLFAFDYENRTCIRVWGTTFKPAMYRELKRLGVRIYDRVMATSLLTEGGKQDSRVIGATGLNVRTGEFYVFRAKATILCTGWPGRNWTFSTELRGLSQVTPANNVGNGHAMAWRTGAEFTAMERSTRGTFDSPYAYPHFGVGHSTGTFYACSMVDANGKEIPWIDRDKRILKTISERYHPAPGQRFILAGTYEDDYEHQTPRLIHDLKERVERGEFALPLYADLPGMPEHERRVIWGLMIGEEGKTKVPVLQTYMGAGFDPDKDLLQSYYMLRGDYTTEPGLPQDRLIFFFGGGLVVDWNLKTSLEGLYAAGEQVFAPRSYPGAVTTGRWAGRRATEYILKAATPIVDFKQVENEKMRVYAPINREDKMDWKELNAGLCRIMQNYCGEPKSAELLKIGLVALKEIETEETPKLYADNPHKLMRTLEVLDILTCDEIITHACLSRKASSRWLNFIRTDYPKIDPPDWHKWITIKLDGERVKAGEMPIDFWEPVRENFEAHSG